MLLDEEIEPSTSVAKTQIFVLIKLGGTVNGFSIEDAAEEQELMALTNAAIEKSVQEEELFSRVVVSVQEEGAATGDS